MRFEQEILALHASMDGGQRQAIAQANMQQSPVREVWMGDTTHER